MMDIIGLQPMIFLNCTTDMYLEWMTVAAGVTNVRMTIEGWRTTSPNTRKELELPIQSISCKFISNPRSHPYPKAPFRFFFTISVVLILFSCGDGWCVLFFLCDFNDGLTQNNSFYLYLISLSKLIL